VDLTGESDLRAAFIEAATWHGTLERAVVSSADVEALLQNRADLGPQMLQACQPAAERLGLKLDRLAIRDLTLPGEFKKTFAQAYSTRSRSDRDGSRRIALTAAAANRRTIAPAGSMLRIPATLFPACQ
jgi:regulator of protease activity HflC (stomatin/prohibitin superfamily)